MSSAGAAGSCREVMLQEFHSGQSRKGLARGWYWTAVGRRELIRTSSPGPAAGQTIDRQLTGRRRAWRSHPISFDVSKLGCDSESRSPHRPKLSDAPCFRPKSLPDERKEGCDVHTLTGFRLASDFLVSLRGRNDESWQTTTVCVLLLPCPEFRNLRSRCRHRHPVTGRRREPCEGSRNGLKHSGGPIITHALSQLAS